jgi:hypothetical protein
MVYTGYTPAHNKATKKYRAKNRESWNAYNREKMKEHRAHWASYVSETKAFRAIDYS